MIQGFKGKFATEDGLSLIKDNVLYGVAAYGVTKYEIPAAAAVVYNGGSFDANVTNVLNSEITLSYEVTNMSNVSVEILKQENVKAVADENAKTITITPNGSGEGKVVILFYNSNQTITSVLNFTL